MRERIVLIAILGFFALCCCISFWFGLVNYTLRDMLGILPTFTPSPVPSATSPDIETDQAGLVAIESVNKQDEYVDLVNLGEETLDLSGWVLVSERGSQTCELAGLLNPGETLRVWTNNPTVEGFDCQIDNEIWDNGETDPAVLYDAEGVEVFRYP